MNNDVLRKRLRHYLFAIRAIRNLEPWRCHLQRSTDDRRSTSPIGLRDRVSVPSTFTVTLKPCQGSLHPLLIDESVSPLVNL